MTTEFSGHTRAPDSDTRFFKTWDSNLDKDMDKIKTSFMDSDTDSAKVTTSDLGLDSDTDSDMNKDELE